MAKFKITEPNTFGPDGEMPIGTVVSVKGDAMPGYIVGKAVLVHTTRRAAVTNPAKGSGAQDSAD